MFFQPTAFSSAFTVSCAVADEHLKLASFTQIKVILYLFRHMSALPEKDDVAKALSIPVSEVEDAVRYWIRAGILGDDSVVLSEQNEKSAKQTVVQNMRPTREDVARRGNEDEQLRFLFQEAQMRFGRTLKASEASTLLWLYDDEGMPLSVILLLLQYAVREDRCNISFIEKTAVSWINKGISSVAEAEREMEIAARQKAAWSIVQRVFGMEYRRPSTKENELALLWIEEWKIPEELLKCAYDTCIDAKSKFSMVYIGKILENWHKKGYQSAAEVAAEKQQKKQEKERQGAAYDIDLFEKMLNESDGEE